jgi:hypothetical protein
LLLSQKCPEIEKNANKNQLRNVQRMFKEQKYVENSDFEGSVMALGSKMTARSMPGRTQA